MQLPGFNDSWWSSSRCRGIWFAFLDKMNASSVYTCPPRAFAAWCACCFVLVEDGETYVKLFHIERCIFMYYIFVFNKNRKWKLLIEIGRKLLENWLFMKFVCVSLLNLKNLVLDCIEIVINIIISFEPWESWVFQKGKLRPSCINSTRNQVALLQAVSSFPRKVIDELYEGTILQVFLFFLCHYTNY